MGEQKIFQRHGHRLVFENDDLDFYLLQLLGYIPYEGTALGECLYTAAQIDEKDPTSWVREWTALARRIETMAKQSQAKGHMVSARKYYLRSSMYYRQAAVLIPPGDDMRQNWESIRRTFQTGAALFCPAIEPVTIPWHGYDLNGYFVPSVSNGKPQPTLIMIGGGEVYSEEMFFWAGAPGRLRGYNTLLVDLPGHVATPFTGLNLMSILKHNDINGMVQSSISATVDYLVKRQEVDTKSLLAYGISGGGYMVATAATTEDRLKAVALSTPIIDMNKVLQAEWPAVLRSVPSFMTGAVVKMASRVNPISRILLQRILWNSGAENINAYLGHMKSAQVDPRQIKIPVLCIASTKDPEECVRQTYEAYDLLPNPNKMKVIFDTETGADAHCQLNNPELVYATLFDWFDEVLNDSYQRA